MTYMYPSDKVNGGGVPHHHFFMRFSSLTPDLGGNQEPGFLSGYLYDSIDEEIGGTCM